MPEDKIIKSGQITVPRLLFLAVCGVALVIIVAKGFLTVGYMLLTAVLCILLGLIAADYGVAMDKVDLSSTPAPATPTISGISGGPSEVVPVASKAAVATADTAVKVKKRAGRPAKRRR